MSAPRPTLRTPYRADGALLAAVLPWALLAGGLAASLSVFVWRERSASADPLSEFGRVILYETRRVAPDAAGGLAHSSEAGTPDPAVRWLGWLADEPVFPVPPPGYEWDVVLGSLEPEHVRTAVVCDPTTASATVDPLRAPVVTRHRTAPDQTIANQRRTLRPAAAPSRVTDVYHLPGTDGDPSRPEGWVKIVGRPWMSGRRVRVVVDTAVPRSVPHPELARTIVEELERRIGVAAEEEWPTVVPWSEDAPLTVLLTPHVSRVSPAPPETGGGLAARSGKSPPSGLFRPDDLRTDLAPPFGCGRAVIYLDSSLRPGPHLSAVLAHEFTHYVACSARLATTGSVRQDDWLNEGLAHVGEIQLGGGLANLERRLEAFRASSAASPLVVTDAVASGRWRDPGCRGAAFLFTKWCADEYGPGFLPDLAAEPEPGTAGVARLMGRSFDRVFVEWGAHVVTAGALASGEPAGPILLSGTALARVRLRNHPRRVWRFGVDESPHHRTAADSTNGPDTTARVFLLARVVRELPAN